MPAEALEPFILNLGQIEDPMQRPKKFGKIY
jgi:hypothetical protein